MEFNHEIIKSEYWSKSDAFLIPLLGLVKDMKYIVNSYLFWDNYSIESYQLVLKFKHKDNDLFMKYCHDYIFKVLDKGNFLCEIYNCDDGSIFILDISIFSKDIELILKGKYSKMSDDAKLKIRNYHRKKDGYVPLYIYAVIEPFEQLDILGYISSIEYVSKKYNLDLDLLKNVGEIGSIYDKQKETLEAKCYNEIEYEHNE